MTLQKAVFKGSWYPDDAHACEQQILEFIKNRDPEELSDHQWVGGIVPHAGWYYSGKIACEVFHTLKQSIAPDVVVIYGMHLPPNASNYMLKDGEWDTPFGTLSIDSEITSELEKHFSFQMDSRAFQNDNTIELQLPFIKYFFPDSKIVPIGIPPVSTSFSIGKKVVDIAKNLQKQLCVIGSTDLTHYGENYGFNPKGDAKDAIKWVRDDNDARIVEAIIEMDPEKILKEAKINQNACCSGAVATAIHSGTCLGADSATPVNYANSFDKSPGNSFVGYVGMVF